MATGPKPQRTFRYWRQQVHLWIGLILLLPLVMMGITGAVLVYETFAAGNAAVGKPSRPDFLLQPGELIQRCAGLTVVAYEDGFLDTPARFVQRVVAVRPVTGATAPPRHALLAAPAP